MEEGNEGKVEEADRRRRQRAGGSEQERSKSWRRGRCWGGACFACLCRATGDLETACRELGLVWRTTTQQLPRPAPAPNPVSSHS